MRFGLVAEADPEKGDDAVWWCEPCKEWQREMLPCTTPRVLMKEKGHDEKMATEITNLFKGQTEDDPEQVGVAKATSCGLSSRVSTGDTIGGIVEDIYDLMTYQDLVNTLKMTPLQAGAQAVKKKNLKGGHEIRYAFPQHAPMRLRLRVFSQVDKKLVQFQTDKEIKPHFTKHAELAFSGELKNFAKDQGYQNLKLRQLAIKDFIERAKAEKPADGQDPTGEDVMPGSSNDGESGTAAAPAESPECTGGEEAAQAAEDEGEVAEVMTPHSKAKKDKHDVNNIPLGRTRSKVPVAIAADQVDAQLGTVLHWIQRSPSKNCLQGNGMSRGSTRSHSLLARRSHLWMYRGATSTSIS